MIIPAAAAGFFPVKLAANIDRIVDLMLIPKSNGFNFAQAKWSVLGSVRPAVRNLFANGATDDGAATRYSDLQERGAILACLLNITTAMQQINLPQKTALEYLKRIIWENQDEFAMGEDRFFAWADPKLIDQIELAKQQHRRHLRMRLPIFIPVRHAATSKFSLARPTRSSRFTRIIGWTLTA